MTSKIKVDNINKVSDDSTIIKKCGSTTTVGSGSGQTIVVDGTTVTLGRCGATVQLASGASQTGFGASGAVTWDTTVKTADFTATSGEGFFVDTSSGAVTVTLPASPSAGNIVAIADYAGTAATNNITIGRNSSNFQGAAEDGKITVTRQAFTLVYVDATQGWVPVAENDSSAAAPKYVAATGGTVTTAGCGNVKIHTFTGPGTFCVSCAGNPLGNAKLNYFVLAGGAGGSGSGPYERGGGGAGGYREANDPEAGAPYAASFLASPIGLTAVAGPTSVTVGAGGGSSSNGSNSIFSTITSAGGGTGGSAGGSGGGGPSPGNVGGNGNTPAVSPPQGNPGATGSPGSSPGGGGGGAGTAGGSPGTNRDGGDGLSNSITDSLVTRAGGGGGSGSSGGQGGTGGGGNGRSNPPGSGDNASPTSNVGSGGGASYGTSSTGGSGSSGLVVIRYKFQN